MKIHEYQGKELLKQSNVPVPRGIVARTPEEAEKAARELGTDVVVVKAQIHAGGRGKGGKATLFVNGKSVAEGRVEKTQPNIFSADETADVGIDNQTPVAEGIGIGAETQFTGTINKVVLEVGPTK